MRTRTIPPCLDTFSFTFICVAWSFDSEPLGRPRLLPASCLSLLNKKESPTKLHAFCDEVFDMSE